MFTALAATNVVANVTSEKAARRTIYPILPAPGYPKVMHHDLDHSRSFKQRARSTDRAEMAIQCVVLKDGHDPVEAVTENFSPTGALLITTDQRKMSGFVQIQFAEKAPIAAVIKWSEPGRHGCEFVRTLTARTFLQVLRGPQTSAAEPVRPGVISRLRKLFA